MWGHTSMHYRQIIHLRNVFVMDTKVVKFASQVITIYYDNDS